MVDTAASALKSYLALHEQAGADTTQDSGSDAGLLAGRLILFSRIAADSALPIAASVAGAASLSIAPSVEDGNNMLRLGLCDFVVRSLDESLRILKNEVRKKQPVSVVVTDSRDAVLAEMAERGVAPDVVVDVPTLEPAMLPGWQIVRWRAKAIYAADAVVAAVLPGDDRLRRRWIAAAPRFLPRSLPVEHVAPLRASEIAALASSDALQLFVN